VREDAAKALARAACPGVPDLAAVLTAALRKERDEGVRGALVRAITGAVRAGAAEGDATAKAAEELLSQSAWWSKLAGLELLAASGRRSQEGTKTLVQALESTEPATRLSACALAGRVSPPGYTPVVNLLITLAGDGDRDTSRAAILALGEVGGPNAALTLRQLRGDGDPDVADAARAALLRLPPEGGEVIPLRREP
jgi:HEAT repeat protein